MKYKVIPPFIPSMGSVSPFVVCDGPYESKESAALWEINKMREHDALRAYEKLPKGFKFEKISD